MQGFFLENAPRISTGIISDVPPGEPLPGVAQFITGRILESIPKRMSKEIFGGLSEEIPQLVIPYEKKCFGTKIPEAISKAIFGGIPG